MKRFLLPLLIFSFYNLVSQTYDSYNIGLLAHIDPNPTGPGDGPDGRRYSGCWGWHQTAGNKEYAIIGSSKGTYFIDVSVPASPSICAFVPGRSNCTWREMKTYQNYCYIVSDDSKPNRFQIVDMSALPATVTVVHDDSTLLERGHTIWIDQNKMYVGGPTQLTGSYPLNVYSLSTPTSPVLLRHLTDDISNSIIGYVHDMYVRNDTIYASCAFQGLYVLKYNSAANTFSILGSYSNYAAQGYNHSSFLTQNGKTLVFCDEIHEAMPIRVVDVQNLANIQSLQTFQPSAHTTPHNPYVLGNNFAVVSCYQDGLMIFDISNPSSASLAGYFDTYPQGGFAQGQYLNTYRGNWGAYPYLPSGIIIANDMQNGVFILDASAAYNSANPNPVTIEETNPAISKFSLSPNPANTEVRVRCNSNGEVKAHLFNMLGQEVFTQKLPSQGGNIDTQQIPVGTYLLRLETSAGQSSQKLFITH